MTKYEYLFKQMNRAMDLYDKDVSGDILPVVVIGELFWFPIAVITSCKAFVKQVKKRGQHLSKNAIPHVLFSNAVNPHTSCPSGNGPSGICLSYLLSGYTPYLSPEGVHPNPILQSKLDEKSHLSLLEQVKSG